MRAAALVLVWSLAGCSAVSGPLDWITPDELTLGRGSAAHDITGGYSGHNEAFAYDGESESTYAALTWDIPGFEKSDGMSRDTQRNVALLIAQMVEEDPEAGGSTFSLLPSPGGVVQLNGDVPPPPPWLPYAFGGAILLFLIFMGLKSRSNGWH